VRKITYRCRQTIRESIRGGERERGGVRKRERGERGKIEKGRGKQEKRRH